MADARKPDARFAQAEACSSAGNPAAAAALMSAAPPSGDGAATECTLALLVRAQAREAMHETGRRSRIFGRALAIDDRDDAQPTTRSASCSSTAATCEGAIDAFTHGDEIDPNHARAWNNLGNTLRIAGRFAEAVAATRRAVAAKPDYCLAWSNLGAMLLDIGDVTEPPKRTSRALALKPERRDNAGARQHRPSAGRPRFGDRSFRARRTRWRPTTKARSLQLGGALRRARRHRAGDARLWHARAAPAELHPRLRLAQRLTLPMVYVDAAEVEAARARYGEGLARLEPEVPALVRGRAAADVIDDLRWTNFLLAYQGEDDRAVAGAFCRDHGAAPSTRRRPEWRAPASATPGAAPDPHRLRVGVLQRRDGGSYFRSWITGLDRSALRNHRLQPSPRRHAVPEGARRRVDQRAQLSGRRADAGRDRRRDPRGRARRSRVPRARHGPRRHSSSPRCASRRCSAPAGDIRLRPGTRTIDRYLHLCARWSPRRGRAITPRR